AADCHGGLASVGAVERSRAEGDRRRLSPAPGSLVRARLAQAAHVAVVACRVRVRVYARRRHRRVRSRAADFSDDGLESRGAGARGARRYVAELPTRSVEPVSIHDVKPGLVLLTYSRTAPS